MARSTMIATAILGLLLCSFPARAAEKSSVDDPMAYAGWGVDAGFSTEPDQIVLGAHLQLGDLAPSVRLDPSADIGFGDHLTLLTVNGDLTYRLAIRNAGHLIVGGSLGLVYRNNRSIDDANLDMGAAAIVGYDFPTRGDPVFVLVRVGLTSFEPDMKVMLGYTFLN